MDNQEKYYEIEDIISRLNVIVEDTNIQDIKDSLASYIEDLESQLESLEKTLKNEREQIERAEESEFNKGRI